MTVLLFLVLAVSASAGKDRKVEPAPKALEVVLQEAGWTLTPERSSTYAAGDIYDMVSHSKVAAREDCFDANPNEGVYTSLHVVQAMQASANVRLGIVKLQGGGVQYKQRTFAEPYLSELPRMRQQLTDECAAYLRTEEVMSLAVLTAVLSAEVKEENCTTLEGGAKVVGVAGGELDVSQQCVVASAGHVAVAYKTRPVAELLGLVAAPSADMPVSSATSEDQSWSTSLVDWDGCSFGPLERIFNGLLLDGNFYVDAASERELVIPIAKKLAESSLARRAMAQVAGVAFRQCDPNGWKQVCETAQARLEDYTAIRDQSLRGEFYLPCKRTCDPLQQESWGHSTYGFMQVMGFEYDSDAGWDALDALSDPADCYQSCDWDSYTTPMSDYLSDKYPTGLGSSGRPASQTTDLYLAVRHLQFIHRQSLRGVAPMEMNKLVDTFCQ